MKQTELATVHADDLSLVEDNILNASQLNILLKATPKKYVHTRPAKGGGQWEYVTGGYVRKVLNLMFGWDWDFEIVDERIEIAAKEVIVKGKLTCRMSNGRSIVKMQYGNKDIIFKRGTEIPLSIGNDLKAAATSALKKCAAEIGVAADIYNKQDFTPIQVVGSDLPADLIKKVKACKSFDELEMLTDAYADEYAENNDWIELISKQQRQIKINGAA